MLLSVKTLLETDLGWSVIEAVNGDEAIKKYEQYKPKVVVLDIMIPKKSGFLVIEKIKPKGSILPNIIVITGAPRPRHRMYAESLGGKNYLNKPFRLERLTELVKTYLSILDEHKLEGPQKITLPNLEQMLKVSEEFVPPYARGAFKQKISELYKDNKKD